MPGLKWATKPELIFLTTKIEEFSSIHSEGKARKKNLAKNLFLSNLYDEFDSLYAGRIKTMDLPRVGTGGTEAERKDVLIEVSLAFRAGDDNAYP
jgi:hypothetical protein